ncbi:MAG: hypothetical protein KDB88_14230 [Flavobacteriales bacterium]|nr:hypothetical protein [Flavobacteriales bacterium]
MERCVWSLIAAGALATPLLAQPNGSAALYPELLRDDLEIWRTALHEAHPDPYRYVTRKDLDRTIDAVRDDIKVPMTASAFVQALRPVLDAIGDAHTRVAPPSYEQEYLQDQAPLIPLAVRVIDGGLYVEEELKGFRSIPPGSLILSINGIPAGRIIEQLCATIPTDAQNHTYRYRVLESQFPELYHRVFEDKGPFEVHYRSVDGKEGRQQIFALTGEEIRNTFRGADEVLSPWHAAYLPDHHSTWWTIRTFDAEELQEEGIRYERFIDGLRKDLRKNEVRTLVIDVRGAGGMELAMAEAVMSVIAQQPYRVVQDMMIRSVVPPTHYDLMTPLPEFYGTVDANYLLGAHGTYNLRPDDPLTDLVEPSAKGFNGKVYVVCDGLTREAGASFVMMAKRSGRARIVGEEVAGNTVSNCGGRELVLTAPNSKVRFHIPLIRYIHEGASTGPLDHGEMPHHPVSRTPRSLAGGRDHVKDVLLEMIFELQ